jgi:hypothetical protein
MALGQMPQNVWGVILEITKWAARIPIALLVIIIAAFFSWLGFWFVFRITEYAYVHWLNHPW